jgi:hypothetical protein
LLDDRHRRVKISRRAGQRVPEWAIDGNGFEEQWRTAIGDEAFDRRTGAILRYMNDAVVP